MTDLPPTELLESSSIAKLMPALIKAQNEFAPAVKDSNNPAFAGGRMYLSLTGVLNAIEQSLRDNNIAIVQQTTIADAGTVLLTRLIHTSGEWLGSQYPVKPVKQDPQGEGSALTYARRYALMALAGIAPEDDDGNAASSAGRSSYEPPTQAPSPADEARTDLLSLCKTNAWPPARVAALFKEHKAMDLLNAGDPDIIKAFADELPELMKAGV